MQVYAPTALLSFGAGLLLPILPLYAKQSGGSFGLAGLIVSAAWIGTMLSDLPSGLLLSRVGFRPSLIYGSLLYGLATVGLGLVHATLALIALQFVGGVGTAFWGVSRHAFIATAVPTETRGRAISIFGGINRLGTFTGPFVGGFVAQFFGLADALIVAGVVALGAVVIGVFFIQDPVIPANVKPKGHSFNLAVVREVTSHNRRDVFAAGTANVFGQMIRSGRQIAIPLFAAYAIGLDAAHIGIVVGVSALVDVSLFVPAGYVMDRFGRKAAAVPSFSVLALGMALVPLTHSYLQLLAVGLVLGLGNGMGAGTMMTLGADLAPPHLTGEFIGFWRLIGDTGRAASPLVVGAVADAVGIVFTSGAIAGLGVIAALMLGLFVRETRWSTEPRPVRSTQSSESPREP
ncbi:MAG TPA: MFS transporter [Nitrolancea sp.]|jgi:MFS family permease|nr:MFS transporter [Nitrolancea sp.]